MQSQIGLYPQPEKPETEAGLQKHAGQDERLRQKSARILPFGPLSGRAASRPEQKQALYERAARAKKQFETQQQFHQIAGSIRDSGDSMRHSYLNWILEQMFSRFDYDSGLQAMLDEKAYLAWRRENGFR